MDNEVLKILIYAVAAIVIVGLAIKYGRHLVIDLKNKRLDTRPGSTSMSMSAEDGSTIEVAKQKSSGDASPQMTMSAKKNSKLHVVEMDAGGDSGPTQ